MKGRLDRVLHDGRDPIALSTLQPGLEYFDTARGFIAHQRAFGVSLSLGGPISAPDDELQVAQRFFDRQGGAALFYVTSALARAMPGFRAAIGADRVLELQRPDTFAAAQVRSAARKAAKAGFTVEELGVDRDFIERVNGRALERSVVAFEMRFLNRPMRYERGPERVFTLSKAGERFGYAVLDPYFEDRRVKGYLLNLVRFEPTSLWGVYLATVEALGRRLANEGVAELSLGFCPLAELDVAGTSALLRPQLKWIAELCGDADYVKRLHGMKSLFGGDWRKRWVVTRTPQLFTPLLALLQLTGVDVLANARAWVRGSWPFRWSAPTTSPC